MERRSVVAKLKAANITVKEVDGKSMFAEVVTEENAKKDASSLLKKALADIPQLIVAETVGKPEYDKDKSEVVLGIRLSIDQNAYKTSIEKLENVLSKIAIAKDSVLLNGTWDESKQVMKVHDNRLGGPPLTPSQKDMWWMWVCTSSTGNHRSLRFNRYLLDADATCLDEHRLAYSMFTGDQISSRFGTIATMLQVRLMNSNGNTVAEGEREVIHNSQRYSSLFYVIDRTVDGTSGSPLLDSIPDFTKQHQENTTFNAFITPYRFFIIQNYMNYCLFQPVQLRIPIAKEELQQVKNITCKVVTVPAAGR